MSTSKSGGCGCGSAGCDCGTGMCTDESFRRPSFFAGQLLTEDDLQALIDYVVGKNRLHNRYLFGEGVVCGLSVTCHPCGGGQVVVAPGFALDCCGNDLVLPCAEEIDIRALLRDLRKRQLQGYECGDPCEKEGDRRQYGLYIVYRETPGDPVAPYDSGDPCGQQKCEPTRICEGYAFELRCECTTERQADLYARILACIGDLETATSAVNRATTLYRVGMKLKAGNDVNSGEIVEARNAAVLLKTWLLTRLEQASSRTRCDLYDRVKAVSLTRSPPDAAGQSNAAAEADDWLELVQILLEYFIDCVCLALNPPCGSCDDTALLLACIELDGCDVFDICNLSRRFVLSPAAMRYWLPVNLIARLVERFCCRLDLSPLFEVSAGQTDATNTHTIAATGEPPIPSEAQATFQTESGLMGADARVLMERFGIDPDRAVAAANFSTSLGGLVARVGRLPTTDLRLRANLVAANVASRLQPDPATLAAAPEVRDAVSTIVREEVAATRDTVVAELRDHVGTSAEAAVNTLGENVSATVNARVAEDIAKVTGIVDKRITSAVNKQLAATPLNAAVEKLAVVRALRKENEKLRADLDKLSATIGKAGGKA